MSILTSWRIIALAIGTIAGSWQDKRREVLRLDCGYLLLHNGGNVAFAGRAEGASLARSAGRPSWRAWPRC